MTCVLLIPFEVKCTSFCDRLVLVPIVPEKNHGFEVNTVNMLI